MPRKLQNPNSWFHTARVRAGYSLLLLADRLGVSVGEVYGWENGVGPDWRYMPQLADILGLPLSELLEAGFAEEYAVYLQRAAVNKISVTIWDCHESFWENRRFVTWQLLRRNSKYKAIFSHTLLESETQSICVCKRSYPPANAAEDWEQWKTRLKVFANFLKYAEKLDGAQEWLDGKSGYEDWPDRFGFGTWLDREEANLENPYQDFSIAELITRIHIPVVETDENDPTGSGPRYAAP